jgi:hypothetical protein
VAALIKKDTGFDATLEIGGRGELSVWVDARKVAHKDHRGFPTDQALLAAVREALGG